MRLHHPDYKRTTAIQIPQIERVTAKVDIATATRSVSNLQQRVGLFHMIFSVD